MTERNATRRELIAGALAGAAAGSLTVGAASAIAASSAGPEAAALSYALQVERLGVVAYRQALATSHLSSAVRAQLQQLMAQESEHTARLEQSLTALGATIPSGPDTVAAAQALLDQHQVQLSLTNLSSEHECLRLLIDVESLTEGAYFKGIPQLQQPSLVKLAVEQMGSDAQHWTVLSGLQHRGDVSQSVPFPFVQGSP